MSTYAASAGYNVQPERVHHCSIAVPADGPGVCVMNWITRLRLRSPIYLKRTDPWSLRPGERMVLSLQGAEGIRVDVQAVWLEFPLEPQ